MPITAILLAALIAVPLAEIAVFILVGERIGLGWTLGLIVLSAVVGVALLRHQGFAVLQRGQRQLDRGGVPVLEVFEGLCLLLAGVFLLTPGFITDVLGLLLLVPPVRQMLYRLVRARLEIRVMGETGPPRPGAPPSRGPTIEGDFEEIDLEPPREEPPDAPRMPPPRGGWNRPS